MFIKVCMILKQDWLNLRIILLNKLVETFIDQIYMQQAAKS